MTRPAAYCATKGCTLRDGHDGPCRNPDRAAGAMGISYNESMDYPGAPRWRLYFDNGRYMIEVELFADGTCEWFGLDRNTVGSGKGNDREPWDKVANDPEFRAVLEAAR